MSSLKFAFILCLFLTTFDVFSHCHDSSQSGDGLSMADTIRCPQADRTDSDCDLWLQDLSNEYKNYNITECQCEIDTTKKKITDCFEKAACKINCEKSISASGSVDRCDNIVKNLPYFCEEKCNRDVAFNIQSIQNTQQFRDCKDDQKEYLQQACDTHIEGIGKQKGAKLICDNGCGSYCEAVVNKMMDNEYCGHHIANSTEFDNCNSVISEQLMKELNSSPLPHGLSWQKCSYDMPCASEIKMAFNQAEQECNNLKSKATTCCEDPLKCAEAGSSDLFKSTGSVAGGITENCQRIQERLKNVGSATQQMADKCKSVASSCVQVCTQQITLF